jgi:WD repeat-containing protein 22
MRHQVVQKYEEAGFDKFMTRFKGHFSCINALAISGNGELLASGGDDRRVLLWKLYADLGHNTPVKMFHGHMKNIFALAFTPKDDKIISGALDSFVFVHDVQTDTSTKLTDHTESVHKIDASLESTFLSVSLDGTMRNWDLRTMKTESALITTNELFAVQRHPLMKHLILVGGNQGYLRLFDDRMLTELSAVQSYNATLRLSDRVTKKLSVSNVEFSQDSNTYLTTNQDFLPVMYSMNSEQPETIFFAEGYKNKTTLKSHCLGGIYNDLVIAGR